jgi:enoyl-CoA hydratase/carnithine racemase
MADRVRVSVEAGIADVRLARPDKMNALDLPMFQALVEAGRSLADDPALRAVVLSGEGRAFCAGLDVQSFAAMANPSGERGPNLLERSDESPANLAQRAAWIWRELPVPVIAAIHGVAYGGGLQIALAADLRLVAPDAKLSVREVHWGLIPDMSGTQTLRHLVRLDVAKELTYTARIVPGPEAVALGLATRTSERPREEAFDLAREIAGRSPDAVRAAKQLLDAASVSSVEEGLRLEEKLQASLIGRPDQVEAVKANLEKRPPRFGDPEA